MFRSLMDVPLWPAIDVVSEELRQFEIGLL